MEAYAATLHAAEDQLWQSSSAEHRSAPMSRLFELAGVTVSDYFLATSPLQPLTAYS